MRAGVNFHGESLSLSWRTAQSTPARPAAPPSNGRPQPSPSVHQDPGTPTAATIRVVCGEKCLPHSLTYLQQNMISTELPDGFQFIMISNLSHFIVVGLDNYEDDSF